MMSPESPKPSRPESQPPSAPDFEYQPQQEMSAAVVAEKKRREKIKAIRETTAELDKEIIGLMPTDDLTKRLTAQFHLAALREGTETDPKRLGEESSGVNATYKATFDGVPAFVKPQSGDATYRYDQSLDTVFEMHQHWDEEKRVFVNTGIPVQEPDIKAHFKKQFEDMSRNRALIAEYYGISPEEVPLSETDFGWRTGVDTQMMAVREMVTSRFDLLTGFDVVPLTTLRTEKLNTDIMSVQKAAMGTDMSYGLFKHLSEQGPNGIGATSFMRIACLDYLFKSLDRGPHNLLCDEKASHFWAIDNGLSCGLSRAQTEEEKNTQGKQRALHKDPGGLDLVRSVPLEIIQKHDNWFLDDEARNNLRELYHSTIAYLAKREHQGMASDKRFLTELDEPFAEELQNSPLQNTNENNGAEIKYVTKLFRLLHGNEKIAKREALEFFVRMKYLIDHGRPPRLEIGTELFAFEGHLQQQEMLRRAHTEEQAA